MLQGKVVSGSIRVGDKLAVMPSKAPAQVLALYDSKERFVEFANPGEYVEIKVNVASDDHVRVGDVLIHRNLTIPSSTLIEAEVLA